MHLSGAVFFKEASWLWTRTLIARRRSAGVRRPQARAYVRHRSYPSYDYRGAPRQPDFVRGSSCRPIGASQSRGPMWELWRPPLRSGVLGGSLPAPGPPDLRTVCCEGAAHSQRQPDRRRNHYRSWRTNTRCRGHLGPGRTWFPPLGAGGCYSAHIPRNLRRRHRLDETTQSPRSSATRPATRFLARWLAQFTARTAGGCYSGRFGPRSGRLTSAWTCRGAAVGWRWAGTTGWRPVWFRERCRWPAGHGRGR